MKKKTIIFIAIIVSAVISIFVWSISMPSRLVYFGGSSSVNPFMQIATKEFDKGKNYEVIYNSNGSQNGVRSVENGTYSVGMISKEIKENTLSKGSVFSNYESVDEDLTDPAHLHEFSVAVKNDNSINAIEFAIDAIVIMYNPPAWLDDEMLNSIDIDLSKKEHKDIIKEIYSNSKYTWRDFLLDINKGNKQLLNKISLQSNVDLLVPISRESGSGTRKSFDDFFGITNVDSGTANSNGSMITQLRDTNGSFGYVSYGFYKNSQNNNLQTPWINSHRLGQDGEVEIKNSSIISEHDGMLNEEYIRQGYYLLKRPFIMLFSSSDKKVDIVLEFVEFLVSEKAKHAYEEEGLVPKMGYLKNGGIKTNDY
ncbi:phosphate ABC transporter substrate-binding protein [Spiroplasma sp. TIUS-1]|uniref:phosphate ABC transporter substrate-binding protein n=1 Tax=Spiroplasma sp. TIUS-1 TaxID=216963 RepID=UPI00139958CA|nr:phosphate ABC transporter substrate-binding protein [Spiroplasma sp. TIUS-1]QHX35785.1 phosphate ABC transporter substrate-binding protein [Spiroplasma sp. TIUS-1]